MGVRVCWQLLSLFSLATYMTKTAGYHQVPSPYSRRDSALELQAGSFQIHLKGAAASSAHHEISRRDRRGTVILRSPQQDESQTQSAAGRKLVSKYSEHVRRSRIDRPAEQWMVHMKAPITRECTKKVNQLIVPFSLGIYIPHHSYLLVAPEHVAHQAQQGDCVLAVLEFHPMFKLQPRIAATYGLHDSHGAHRVDADRNKSVNISKVRQQYLRVHLALPPFAFTPSLQREHPVNQSAIAEVIADWQTLIPKHLDAAGCRVHLSSFSGRRSSRETDSWTHQSRESSMKGVDIAVDLRSVNSFQATVSIRPVPQTDKAELRVPDIFDQCVKKLVHWLADQPLVHWIEMQSRFKTMNKWANVVVQTDEEDNLLYWEKGPPHTLKFLHTNCTFCVLEGIRRIVFEPPTRFRIYLDTWNTCSPGTFSGLHGENQVVAMSDTGLDYDSCFFHDPAHPIPINTTNTRHRKVVRYMITEDDHGCIDKRGGDHVDGHGTHTAGTIAGEVMTNDADALKGLQPYNGVAYKAKLAVYDYESCPEDYDLYMPESIYEDYFLDSYRQAGARISSNSWGDDTGDYDSYTRESDRFQHDFQDYLVVYAAGNRGDKTGFFSIATPGVAKNALTVGSCHNHPRSFVELGQDSGIEVHTAGGGPPLRYHATPAEFGPAFTNGFHRDSRGGPAGEKDVRLVLGQPSFGCSELTNKQEVAGAALLIDRGYCTFFEKVRFAQQAGAVLVVVANDADGDTDIMTEDVENVTSIIIPSIMVVYNPAFYLFTATQHFSNIKFLC